MKRNIGKRLTLIQFVMMGIMAAILIIVSYQAFREIYIRFYNEKAQDVVNMVAAQTDWEKLEHYAKTGEADDDAKETLAFYDSVKKNFSGLYYLYLFVPGTDKLTYIYDAKTGEKDASQISKWGDIFYYTEDEYEKLLPDVKAKKASTKVMLLKSELGEGLEAWAPVLDDDGNLQAMVEADYNMLHIREDLNSFSLRIISVFIICLMGYMAIMLLYTRKTVVTPIEALNSSVDTYEHGELELKLDDFKKDDEIRHLAISFKDMVKRIQDYTEEITKVTAEKERIGAELELATQIQADMLPNIFPAFPEREDFDIYASMTPAKEVGGDFYDFFLIDDNHLGLVVADVSGKGVPAALFMMMSKILINNFTMIAGPDASPAEILAQANDTICKNNKENMFVTVWLGIITLSTGHCIAANAGHEYPIIKKANGQFELFKEPHGFVVGGMEEMVYVDYEFTLERGGALFVYTDGVVEATDSNGELYGMERTVNALNLNEDASPDELLHNVKADVDRFVGDAPQFDDLTMLAIKLL